MNDYMHRHLLPGLLGQLSTMFRDVPLGSSFEINGRGRVCNVKGDAAALQDTLSALNYGALEPVTHTVDLNALLFRYVSVEVSAAAGFASVRYLSPVDLVGLQRYLYASGFDRAEQEPEDEPRRKRCRVEDIPGDWTDDEGATDGESGAFD